MEIDFDLEYDETLPDLDFSEIIKFNRRSTSEVSRQITVIQYKTYNRPFSFSEIIEATQKCRLKPTEDFGVIKVRTSQDAHYDNNLEKAYSDIGNNWVRALYAVIGDTNFRWLDINSSNIYEYILTNVLKETFLVEYYEGVANQLRFLTYGGSRFSERIQAKHTIGFGYNFYASMESFSYEFMRDIFSRQEFLDNLKRIGYLPSGEDGFGSVDIVTTKTRYQNVIDLTADRIKEICDNDKILISEFESRFPINIPSVKGTLNIRFEVSSKGQIIFHLPRLEFHSPLTDIERENIIYDVVRSAYAHVTNSSQPRKFYAPEGQLILDFLRDST
ncbi:MAG: hypothetical protein OT477_22075 [Chloroflexi bacterium]|nr:hypothetical protein [Chloroflexota bacterium]